MRRQWRQLPRALGHLRAGRETVPQTHSRLGQQPKFTGRSRRLHHPRLRRLLGAADCPEVSWATGTDTKVNSLAVRLLGPAGAVQRSWNYAETGSRMADLPGQMAQAATKKPELVTVMAGANDACRSSVSAMTSVAEYRTQFQDALTTLREALPKTQVYVSSVPDLKRLWSEGRTNQLSKQIWKLGICPSMLGDADALDSAATLRRDTVQDRVEAYNSVLREVCAKDRLVPVRWWGGVRVPVRHEAVESRGTGSIPAGTGRPGLRRWRTRL